MDKIIKKIYSNINYNTSELISDINLGLILTTFGTGFFSLGVNLNNAASLMMLSILNMIYYIYSNGEKLSLHTKDIKEIKSLYNDLIKDYNKLNKIFGFQNPVEIYTLYNKMLYAGYLSKDKEFHFGKDKVKDIMTIQGANVINGEAVCRHIAPMLKDIYLDYGITSYDISVFQKDTKIDEGMLAYYQRELQKISIIKGIPLEDLTYLLEDKIQEVFSYYIDPKDIGNLTNHRITKAVYQGKDYYLDPTQTRMYKPSNNTPNLLVSEDGRRDTKIISRANLPEEMKINPSTPFSEDLKYVKSTINIYKQNKDILERFYKEHQELYNYISNLLSNIKVKRKAKR